jgi:hypothetical protein
MATTTRIPAATATDALIPFGASAFCLINTTKGNRFLHFEISEDGLFEIMGAATAKTLGFPLVFSQSDISTGRYVIALQA